jgi:hypothetical protein
MEASLTPPSRFRVAIVSDIHYAGAEERARGHDYESRLIANPLLRAGVWLYRHFIWLRHPLEQAPQLERFLTAAGAADFVVANGDYSCDSGAIGVSDPAALASAQVCVGKLRAQFGDRIRFTLGDHELGKLSIFGGIGGMRLASLKQATATLGLPAFWKFSVGNYLLLGVASPLIALPASQTETLPAEWEAWLKLRAAHLAEIRAAFDALQPQQRVILFCHDPTALPFLWQEETIRRHLPQIEQTIIGHLHTRLVLWKSRWLSGIPPIRFLGNTVRRLTSALHEADHWWPFHVRLCPALSGIQLLNDGGYYTMELDPAAKLPAQFSFHPLARKS